MQSLNSVVLVDFRRILVYNTFVLKKYEGENVEKENILGYEKIPKLLIKFALPSIFAMIISSLYNIVDQIFIGQGVGMLGNGATNVAFPLTTICLALSLLIGVGCAAGFSLKLGAGNREAAAKYVGNAVIMMFVIGVTYAAVILLFAEPMLTLFGATKAIMPYALEYTKVIAVGIPLLVVINVMSNLIRADGSPTYSMLCMVSGAVVNTVLDYLFVMVFPWGMAGAAWATVIGQAVSFIMVIIYIKKFKNVTLTRESFKIEFKIWGTIAGLGLSNSLNQVAITLVQIVMNNSLKHYGALSSYGADIPIAACGIVMKVNSILVSIFVGMSQGSQPIIGFNYGAGKYKRARKTYVLACVITVAVSLIGWFFFQFTPRPIIELFGDDGNELYFQFAEMFMRTFLLMIAINGVQTISSNFFSAIGKPLKGAFLSLTRQVLFLIPLLLIMPIFFGVEGILYTAPISDTLAFILSIAFVLKEFSIMKKQEKLQNI